MTSITISEPTRDLQQTIHLMIAHGAKQRLTRQVIESRVRELRPWFHDLDLRGVRTAPDHFLHDYPMKKWRRFEHAIPADLRGQSVLDIGCNAGFYAFELKRRGAERVVAIDTEDQYLEQARFAAEVLETDIEFHKLSVYDIAALGERFDIVLFMGVLYHLRHPLLALDLIHQHAAKDLLIVQSMLRGSRRTGTLQDDYDFWETGIFYLPSFPRLHFIERSFAGDSSNWWIPNRACMEAMLRSAGFDIVNHPEEEVYICRRASLPEGQTLAVYPARQAPPSPGTALSTDTRSSTEGQYVCNCASPGAPLHQEGARP